MAYETRIKASQVGEIDQKDFDLIVTVGTDEDWVAEGREVKEDKRMAPFVSRDHPGTETTPRVLLIEVDAPDDQEVIQDLKKRLGVYQPLKSRG